MNNPASNTGVAKREKSPFEHFVADLQLRKKTFADSLPKHVSVDRFMKSAMIAMTKQPKLLQCDVATIFKALNEAANLGLDVSGVNNSAYLVPYGKTCQLIPGYGGLIDLATRGGKVLDITPYAIKEGDEVTVFYGTDAKIVHKPDWKNSNAEVLGVYAVATLNDGTKKFTPIMSVAECARIRDESKGYQASKTYGKDSPWDTNFEAMCLKSSIRRIFKTLPVSVELLTRALELDDRNDAGLPPLPPDKKDAIDVEGYSRMVDDAKAAEDAEGTPGKVDAAIERTEATFMGRGETREEATPAREEPDRAAEAIAFARRRASTSAPKGDGTGLPQ